MNTLKLDFTLEETNTILNALGDQPYKRVFQLIEKIQQQAAQQVEQETDAPMSPEIEAHSDNIAQAS